MREDSSPPILVTVSEEITTMSEFTVVLEREADGRYSVYVPDLPGCASMGDTRPEALKNIREAISLYVQGLRKQGKRVPKPRARIEVVRVDAA